jgi:hypothetical protein
MVTVYVPCKPKLLGGFKNVPKLRLAGSDGDKYGPRFMLLNVALIE